jgi:hypothetical protein
VTHRFSDVLRGDRREIPRLHRRRKVLVAEDGALVHLLEELVLGVEREVQRLHGNAGALGDRLHGRRAVAVTAEQFVGRIEHAPASGRRLLLSRLTLDTRHTTRILVAATSDYH